MTLKTRNDLLIALKAPVLTSPTIFPPQATVFPSLTTGNAMIE